MQSNVSSWPNRLSFDIVSTQLKARLADISVIDDFYEEQMYILTSQSYRAGWDARDLPEADRQTPDMVDLNRGVDPPGVYT